MTGKVFGKLRAVRPTGERSAANNRMWLLVCECGNERIADGYDVRSGKYTACNSCSAQRTIEAVRTHGKSSTPTFRAWSDMLTRCYNPKVKGFSSWGGRGIIVCERWRSSFEAFYADMGEKPCRMTLERIDNNGNYEPGNCRWATRKDQNRNTRKTLFITHGGDRKPLREWSELTGIKPCTLERRLKAGYAEHEIFRPLAGGNRGGIYARGL